MELNYAKDMEAKYFANLFNRLPVVIDRGEDVWVYTKEGRKILDAFAGVAVSSIGHCHPALVKTIKAQAEKMIHVSNWVYSEPQLQLAKKLTELTGLEKAFFTNSGAEAVEAAIKLARASSGKKNIISMEGSFHGRTLGALSATHNENYRKPFEPLMPCFEFARYNDIESLSEKIGKDTAAVLVEPILGEAGAIAPDKDYLKEVRKITSENEVLLIVDEIQSGFGRTGSWFEYQRAGIVPDILTCAKGMGGGFPIGAIMFQGIDFKPGQHGGTYNGGPLGCKIANTVIDVIEKEKLVENSRIMGDALVSGLDGYNVHGAGLMLGVEVENGRNTAIEMLERDILAIYSGNTLRLLPPLTLKKEHVDIIIEFFK